MTLINSLRVRFLGDKVLQRTAWRVADQLGWETTYDAEFVALTQLQADVFVTSDAIWRERSPGSSKRPRSMRWARVEQPATGMNPESGPKGSLLELRNAAGSVKDADVRGELSGSRATGWANAGELA